MNYFSDIESELEFYPLSDTETQTEEDSFSVLGDQFLEENEIRENSGFNSEHFPNSQVLFENTSFPLPDVQTPQTPAPINLTSTPKAEDFPSLKTLNPVLHTISTRRTVMNYIGKCREFNGYPQENAKRFMDEFQSYALLNDLSDKRRVAAFHLQLKGPALTWFSSLSDTTRESWQLVEIMFCEKYINFNWQSSAVLMESEMFNQLCLRPGQNLEDFYSSLMEKGSLLQKPDHEILAKFVSGLPDRMAFFVRAGVVLISSYP